MSLAALAASRRGGPTESTISAPQETAVAPVPPVTPPLNPRVGLIPRHELDGAATLAGIIGNNNFEIAKVAAGGSVDVAMGTPVRPTLSADQAFDEVPLDKVKQDAGCQLAAADCEEEKK